MKNKFIKDVAMVTSSNVVYMLANILAGFILPTLISVEDYGYYKIYTLYLSYSGLLHFGFIDGVYLEYSGNHYEDLNVMRFRTYSFFMILLESVLAVAITMFSFFFLKSEYKIIGCFIAVGLIAINVGQYYQYVAQAVSRFSEFSKRKIYNAIGIIVVLLVLWIYNRVSGSGQSTYEMYVTGSLVINLVLTLWFLITYKDITFGTRYSLKQEKNNIIQLLKRGFILTIAYEASRIILLIDRQFVSMLFPLELYAKYAFAYNILSCVTNVIVGISTVLFPKLKRMSEEESVDFFQNYMGLLTSIVCFFLVGFYPVVWIVKWLLPNYIESLVYFKIIFPVLALSSCITIIVFSYYKIYDKIKVFLAICICNLLVSVLTNLLAYNLFHTAEAISFASVITTIIWYLLSIWYLQRKYHVKWIRNFVYAVLMICVFYSVVFFINSSCMGIAVYFVSFTTITFIFQKETIRNFWKSARR